MLANRKGFTLVEMIFVLAITVIISSITLAFRKPKASAQAQIALVTHAFQLARSQA
ncbi:prepilin-type N-terminal cleavage/methylation domain-containing protein [Sharpea azabuensis]|nr:prepilin-type N-terminal cleavage/methylation domain-containing protein [Sharpea azabuensis]